jgi:hypothetical protein
VYCAKKLRSRRNQVRRGFGLRRRPYPLSRMRRLRIVGSVVSITTTLVPPIWARTLQRLWCRSFQPLELPAVYQPLPVSIPRGWCGEIVLSGASISRLRPWPLRRDSWRRSLRLSGGKDARHGAGERDADQGTPHPDVLHGRSVRDSPSKRLRLAFWRMQPKLSPKIMLHRCPATRHDCSRSLPLSPRLRGWNGHCRQAGAAEAGTGADASAEAAGPTENGCRP